MRGDYSPWALSKPALKDVGHCVPKATEDSSEVTSMSAAGDFPANVGRARMLARHPIPVKNR